MNGDERDVLLGRIEALEIRLRQLERAGLPATAAIPPSPVAQGDMIAADATPAWGLLSVGDGRQILMVNSGGTDPEWRAADWDDLAAASGSDLVHSHQTNPEGGQISIAGISNIPGTIASILTDHDKAAHDALALDHGTLSGLSDDDHTQYPLAGGTETISGVWSYTNGLVMLGSSIFLRNGGALNLSEASTTRAYLYHNGSDLYIRSFVHGGRILLQGEDAAGVNRAMIYSDPDTGVVLYYGASLPKLETTNIGVKVTGMVYNSTPPYAQADRNSNQSIPNATWTAISFNVQVHDTDGIFGPTSTQLKPTRSGYYAFGGSGTFAINTTNQRGIAIRKNGGVWYGMNVNEAISTYNHQLTTSWNTWMNGTTDYIEIMVFQNSGAALNIIPVSAAYYANSAWIYRIA